jgi:hypothetical protein
MHMQHLSKTVLVEAVWPRFQVLSLSGQFKGNVSVLLRIWNLAGYFKIGGIIAWT